MKTTALKRIVLFMLIVLTYVMAKDVSMLALPRDLTNGAKRWIMSLDGIVRVPENMMIYTVAECVFHICAIALLYFTIRFIFRVKWYTVKILLSVVVFVFLLIQLLCIYDFAEMIGRYLFEHNSCIIRLLAE